MDSQPEKYPSQQSLSTGMSFSGFTIQKKASQSQVKLEAGASLEGERTSSHDEGSKGDGGKDYVLSLEGKTIHRLVKEILCFLSTQGFPKLTKSCNHFSKKLLTTAVIKSRLYRK